MAGSQNSGIGRTLIAAQRRRTDNLSSPACVTYHLPSINERSPSATDTPYASVSLRSVCMAILESSPHTRLASLQFTADVTGRLAISSLLGVIRRNVPVLGIVSLIIALWVPASSRHVAPSV